MKFLDVAHLYLPFSAKTDDNLIFNIVGVSLDERLFQVEDENNSIWWNDTVFTPILRPIAAITLEEKKELWRIVFGYPFGENGIIVTHKKARDYAERWIMHSGVERLCIAMDGDVWADSDLERHAYNKHKVTLFLLKKGFDLFEFLDRKEAVLGVFAVN